MTLIFLREICKLNLYLIFYKYRRGNGPKTVGYEADGEASDWMLVKHGILAASPELGTLDERSMEFFVEDRDVVIEILQ